VAKREEAEKRRHVQAKRKEADNRENLKKFKNGLLPLAVGKDASKEQELVHKAVQEVKEIV